MVKKAYKANVLKKQTVHDRIKANQERFLTVYKAKACNITASCEAININRLAYYEWREKYPSFDSRCKECEAGLIDYAETQMLKNIEAGKEVSLIFFLCNKAKDKWQNVSKVTHDVPEGTRIKYEIVHVK